MNAFIKFIRHKNIYDNILWKKGYTDQEFFFNSLKIENLLKIAVPGSNVRHVL